MSLIKCAACAREISPNAAACPHCGEPMRPQVVEKTTNWLKVIASLLMVVGVVGAMVQSVLGYGLLIGFFLFVVARFRD